MSHRERKKPFNFGNGIRIWPQAKEKEKGRRGSGESEREKWCLSDSVIVLRVTLASPSRGTAGGQVL